MAGRGATSFQKRQKEMQRKERQQEKFAKKMERKKQPGASQQDGGDTPEVDGLETDRMEAADAGSSSPEVLP